MPRNVVCNKSTLFFGVAVLAAIHMTNFGRSARIKRGIILKCVSVTNAVIGIGRFSIRLRNKNVF